VGERLVTADRWGRRDKERVGAGEKNGADKPGPRGSEREGGEGALVGADRQGPPIRNRGRAGMGARAGLGLVGRLGLNWVFLFLGIF
jgi:hypothetical protein